MIAASAGAVVAVVGAVVGLALTLCLVVAVLWSQLRRNTTAIVREENGDLRDRLRTVEELEEQCKGRLAELEATTAVLKDMVTGASAIGELATVVAFNHADVLKRLDDVAQRLAGRPA